MQNLSFLAVGLLLGLGFAGCVGEVESAGNEADRPQASAGPAEFDEATGAIRGSVTDTELIPLAGAQVGLLKDDTVSEDVSVSTDDSGQFTISKVPPGEHQIVAQALGYEASGKKIIVVQGEVVEIALQLEKLPEAGPYFVRDVRRAEVSGLMIKLTPQCIYDIGGTGNTLAKTCQGVRTGCTPSANCEVHYTSLLEDNLEKDAPWKTIIAEVTWQPQSGVTGKGFMFDITAPNVTRGQGGSINQGSPYTFFKMQPKPPIIWKINGELLVQRKIPEADWCCDWFYRLFPGYCDLGSVINNCEATPDYGIAQNNPATVYMTFFFVEEAKPEYTALPDQ